MGTETPDMLNDNEYQNIPVSAGTSKSGSDELLIDPWPVKDVLRKLVDAANILLNECDYDGHGYEQIQSARDRAVSIIEST